MKKIIFSFALYFSIFGSLLSQEQSDSSNQIVVIDSTFDDIHTVADLQKFIEQFPITDPSLAQQISDQLEERFVNTRFAGALKDIEAPASKRDPVSVRLSHYRSNAVDALIKSLRLEPPTSEALTSEQRAEVRRAYRREILEWSALLSSKKEDYWKRLLKARQIADQAQSVLIQNRQLRDLSANPSAFLVPEMKMHSSSAIVQQLLAEYYERLSRGAESFPNQIELSLLESAINGYALKSRIPNAILSAMAKKARSSDQLKILLSAPLLRWSVESEPADPYVSRIFLFDLGNAFLTEASNTLLTSEAVLDLREEFIVYIKTRKDPLLDRMVQIDLHSSDNYREIDSMIISVRTKNLPVEYAKAVRDFFHAEQSKSPGKRPMMQEVFRFALGASTTPSNIDEAKEHLKALGSKLALGESDALHYKLYYEYFKFLLSKFSWVNDRITLLNAELYLPTHAWQREAILIYEDRVAEGLNTFESFLQMTSNTSLSMREKFGIWVRGSTKRKHVVETSFLQTAVLNAYLDIEKSMDNTQLSPSSPRVADYVAPILSRFTRRLSTKGMFVQFYADLVNETAIGSDRYEDVTRMLILRHLDVYARQLGFLTIDSWLSLYEILGRLSPANTSVILPKVLEYALASLKASHKDLGTGMQAQLLSMSFERFLKDLPPLQTFGPNDFYEQRRREREADLIAQFMKDHGLEIDHSLIPRIVGSKLLKSHLVEVTSIERNVDAESGKTSKRLSVKLTKRSLSDRCLRFFQAFAKQN